MISSKERAIIDRMKVVEDVYSYRDLISSLINDGRCYKILIDEFIDFLLVQIEKNKDYTSQLLSVFNWPFVDASRLEQVYLKSEDDYTIYSNVKYYEFPKIESVIAHFTKNKSANGLVSMFNHLLDESKYHKYVTIEVLETIINNIDESVFNDYYSFDDNLYALARLLYYTLNEDFEPFIEEMLKKIIEHSRTKDLYKYLPLMKVFNLHGLIMFK